MSAIAARPKKKSNSGHVEFLDWGRFLSDALLAESTSTHRTSGWQVEKPSYPEKNYLAQRLALWMARLGQVGLFIESCEKAITVGGTVNTGDQRTAVIGGTSVSYTTSSDDASNSDIAAGWALTMQANTAVAQLVDVWASSAVVYLRARVPGVDFTLTTSVPVDSGTADATATVSNMCIAPYRVRLSDEDLVNATDLDFVFGSGSTENTGGTAGDSRMLFDKSKGAFRAGHASAGEWDDASRGDQSVAMGFECTASAAQSVALGRTCTASADQCFAGGALTLVSGSGSFAWGTALDVSGEDAVAFGNGNTVSGDRSSVTGNGNIVSGDDAVCSGTANDISGDRSICSGADNVITANDAACFGLQNVVGGTGSLCVGELNTTGAAAYGSAAIGTENNVTGAQSYAFGKLHTVSGDRALAVGEDCTVSGNFGVAEGELCTASGAYSRATGHGAVASAYGEEARAAGMFDGDVGTAQAGSLLLMGTTTGSNVNLQLGGTGGEWTPPAGVYCIDVRLVAIVTGTGDAAVFACQLACKSAGGTLTIGSGSGAMPSAIYDSASIFGTPPVTSAAAGALRLQTRIPTGGPETRWHAELRYVRVSA